MDTGILGTFAVRVNGISITPSAPKPRQVLAFLVLHADQVVSVETLTEELWGSQPPRSARRTLQTYILQLRELITAALEGEERGPGHRRRAKDVLLTVPGGYQLRTGQGSSDVREFERLAGMGYRAVDAGNHAEAARCLREALALWTGPALAGVTTGRHLQTEVKRLEEIRLCVLDQRIEADLRLGRHRELLGELTVLVSRYPMHESLWGQHMLALYRSGRRSEALEAYQRLRSTLVRNLGLEPSGVLCKLQRSILLARPDGLPAPPEPEPRAAAGSPPTGRDAAGSDPSAAHELLLRAATDTGRKAKEALSTARTGWTTCCASDADTPVTRNPRP